MAYGRARVSPRAAGELALQMVRCPRSSRNKPTRGTSPGRRLFGHRTLNHLLDVDLESHLKELHRAESDDARGEISPRSKKHDDKTVIVITPTSNVPQTITRTNRDQKTEKEMALEVAQLIMNFLALLIGGYAVKFYVENLKESISQVARDRDGWKGRAEAAESRTPENMERNLNDRIKIREEELDRLKEDVESNSGEIELLSTEIETLRETLRGAGGFLQMLALDEGAEVADFEFDPEEVEIRHIGMIGVDSGQVMITDPCYIDSQWQREGFDDLRVVRDPKSLKEYIFRQDFHSYAETLPGYNSSVSTLLDSGRLTEVPPEYEKAGRFSYAGTCHTTLGHGGGQLNYLSGEPGAGVVLATGWGDGFYPVYGEIRNGRMYRIYVSV